MQVQSLASLSGLGIWCFSGCDIGLRCSFYLTPNLGNSLCHRYSLNFKKIIAAVSTQLFFFFFFWLHPWHTRVPGQGLNPRHRSDSTKPQPQQHQVVNLLCWAARELPLFRLLKELCDFLRSMCASSSDTVLNHLYCLWLGAQTDRPRALCVSAPAVLRDRAEQSLQPAGIFSLNPALDSLAVLQLLCFLLAFSAANLRGLLWGGVS